MVKILEEYQKYVPIVDGNMEKLKISGDGLTVMRARDAILGRGHEKTPQSRLDGFFMCTEDWHELALMLQVKN